MKQKKQQTQPDMLSGPILPLILRIAVPASVGFFFNTMYNVVDTYFAGKISSDALAGMSMSFPVFIAILAVAIGIGTGTTTLVSNALGAGRKNDAVKIQAQAITMSVVSALALIAIVLPLLKPIFSLFSSEGAVLDYGFQYTRVILVGGAIFFSLNFTLNAALNARGLTKIYRNLLIVSFFANVGLDPLFLYGLNLGGVQLIPAMGVAGIALATVVVQIGGAIYMFVNVFRYKALEGCDPLSFRIRWPQAKEIMQMGSPTAIDMLMISAGATIIVAFLGSFGTAPIAAYGIALRIEQIALIPTIGINIALSAIVGQNNGAGNYARIREAYRTSKLLGLVVFVGIMTPLLVFHRPIIGIFTNDTVTAGFVRSYLFTQAIAFYAYVLLFQSRSVLEGIKRPGIIAGVGISRQIVLPLLIFPLLTRVLGLEVLGIWFGIVVINWLLALVLAIYTLAKLREVSAGSKDGDKPGQAIQGTPATSEA